MSSMSSAERFALLRNLLLHSPAPFVWQQLYTLLESWPQGEELWLAIEYAEQHLEHWPDSLRLVSSECALVQERRQSSSTESPLWRLFRGFYNTEQHGIPLTELSYWPEARLWTHFHDERSQTSTWEFNALAKSPLAPSLQHLTLPGFSLERKSIEHLAFAFPRLQSLDVSSVTQHRNLPTLAMMSEASWADSLQALALPLLSWQPDERMVWNEELPFPSLGWLSFSGNPPPQEQDAFFRSQQWRTLHTLDVQDCYFSMFFLLTLLQQGNLQNIRQLYLSSETGMSNDPELFAEMAHMPVLQHLETLEIGHASLCPQLVEELMRSSVVWKKLRRLRLEYSELQEESIRALVRAPFYNSLEHLDLDSTCREKGELNALWTRGLPPSLQTLRLCDNHLTAKDMKAFAENLQPNNSLKKLALAINPIGHKGTIQLLEASSLLTNLRSLNLNHCNQTAKTVTALKSSSLYNGLGELFLSIGNHLRGETLDRINREKGTANPMVRLSHHHEKIEQWTGKWLKNEIPSEEK